jgi:hypothetical protein
MGVRTFWMEPTAEVAVRLRVYESRECPGDPTAYPACHAGAVIEQRAPRSDWVEDLPGGTHRQRDERVLATDPRWPAACEACGRPFGPEARRQVWAERLYAGAPEGRPLRIRDFPVGALWSEPHLEEHPAYVGPDGLSLHVRTPGGVWCIDSQASNCTRDQNVPVEGEPGVTRFTRTHYCWPRKGDPRTEPVDVAKEHGPTCSAGAGSIICGDYHGFLRNGELT